METPIQHALNAALVVTLLLGGAAMAQAKPPLSAADPNTLGWMQGSPPPADKTIRFTDRDFFRFPNCVGRFATSAS